MWEINKLNEQHCQELVLDKKYAFPGENLLATKQQLHLKWKAFVSDTNRLRLRVLMPESLFFASLVWSWPGLGPLRELAWMRSLIILIIPSG